MKHILLIFAASWMVSQTSLATAERPLLLSMPVRHVFVPSGFDDNDNVQVVLEGAFPDTCHKLAHTEVLKSDDGKSLEVIQWARKFSGICIPTTVPFTSEVSLGRLAAGSYKIASVGVASRELIINRAVTSSQDESLYAPVTRVTVGRQDSGHYIATIQGRLPNDCFALKKTEILKQDQVLVLLPVLNYEDTGHCSADQKPIEFNVDLPTDLGAGKYLVHVRSMSGKAVNAVFFADGD